MFLLCLWKLPGRFHQDRHHWQTKRLMYEESVCSFLLCIPSHNASPNHLALPPFCLASEPWEPASIPSFKPWVLPLQALSLQVCSSDLDPKDNTASKVMLWCQQALLANYEETLNPRGWRSITARVDVVWYYQTLNTHPSSMLNSQTPTRCPTIQLILPTVQTVLQRLILQKYSCTTDTRLKWGPRSPVPLPG